MVIGLWMPFCILYLKIMFSYGSGKYENWMKSVFFFCENYTLCLFGTRCVEMYDRLHLFIYFIWHNQDEIILQNLLFWRRHWFVLELVCRSSHDAKVTFQAHDQSAHRRLSSLFVACFRVFVTVSGFFCLRRTQPSCQRLHRQEKLTLLHFRVLEECYFHVQATEEVELYNIRSLLCCWVLAEWLTGNLSWLCGFVCLLLPDRQIYLPLCRVMNRINPLRVAYCSEN